VVQRTRYVILGHGSFDTTVDRYESEVLVPPNTSLQFLLRRRASLRGLRLGQGPTHTGDAFTTWLKDTCQAPSSVIQTFVARLIEDVRANLVTRPKTNPFKNKKPTGPQTPVLHVSGITRETQKTLLTGEIELKTGAK
jgi:hypothetical protein